MKTATNEKPVLFSGPMIRALRAGRKTVTRRIVIPQTAILTDEMARSLSVRPPKTENQPVIKYPYGSAGTRLWVRESCWLRPELTRKMLREGADTWPPVIYAADQTETDREWTKEHGWIRRNSIHMPRMACRLVLEVEDVRVERLQEITEAEIAAEGFTPGEGIWAGSIRAAFSELWDELNADRGFPFASSPWVWRVQFKVVEGLA